MLNDFFAKICYLIASTFNIYVELHKVIFGGIINTLFKLNRFTPASFGWFLALLFMALMILGVDIIIIMFIWLEINLLFLNLRKTFRRRFLTDVISNQYVVGKVIYKELKRTIKLKKSYLVTIKYYEPELPSDIFYTKETFDNKDLYSKYEIGDKVSVILVEYFGKDFKVFDRTLELPE